MQRTKRRKKAPSQFVYYPPFQHLDALDQIFYRPVFIEEQSTRRKRDPKANQSRASKNKKNSTKTNESSKRKVKKDSVVPKSPSSKNKKNLKEMNTATLEQQLAAMQKFYQDLDEKNLQEEFTPDTKWVLR